MYDKPLEKCCSTLLYNNKSSIDYYCSPLQHGRRDHGCIGLRGRHGVLVVGGWNNNNIYSVELYDPVADKWTLRPSLSQELQCIILSESIRTFLYFLITFQTLDILHGSKFYGKNIKLLKLPIKFHELLEL